MNLLEYLIRVHAYAKVKYPRPVWPILLLHVFLFSVKNAKIVKFISENPSITAGSLDIWFKAMDFTLVGTDMNMHSPAVKCSNRISLPQKAG